MSSTSTKSKSQPHQAAPATCAATGRSGLAGGVPLGAIFEIGALCALEEAVRELDLNALDGYVGVSAGGVVAAALANGMTPRQLCTAFIENDGPRNDMIKPSLFVRPALL
jgi:NTE family protein